ncbi:SpoIIE family protein phosphatase [Luteitalea sp.]|uniref:SpoIIE family protein phosphatase n=1 Tax=Luteitalea sp. TaxID=2004800 RepID=UPI0025C51C76|nr:SpoIIE family protein phosphatase [Luteitalea sp.]
MTPTTTSRPRAVLRAAVAALGVCLVVLAAMNLFIVGRAATDENIFVDPLSGVYVVERIPGLPGVARQLSGPGSNLIPREVTPGTSLERGDVLMEVGGERVRGTTEARTRARGPEQIEATVFRARVGQVLSVVVPVAQFEDALRSISNTVLVVRVTPGGASDRAGMLPGDVITRINGQGFSGTLDADRIMRASQVGRTSQYDVLRDGEPLTLDVQLSAFGIAPGGLLLFVVGFLFIASGTLLATLRAHIKAAYYLGLGWMGAGFTIAVVLNRPRRTLPGWYVFTSDVVLALSATLGVAAWLHAQKYFPRERPGLVSRRWAIRGAYVLAIVLAVANLALTWTAPFSVDGLSFPAAVIMMTYASLVSIRTRRTYSAEDRQISRPTSTMTSIAVGFVLTAVVVGLFTRGRNLPGLAVPVVQIFAGLLFLAVLAVHLLVIGRYRLLELDLRVRRNVQYLLVSTAWTVLVVGAGLFLWWELMHLELPLPNVRLTSDAIEVLPTPVDVATRAIVEKGVLIAAGVVFAYAFRSLLKRGHRFLAEQYYQEGYDYRRATREFSDVMGPRMDLDGLADGLLTVVDRLMPVKRAGVVFVQGDRLVSSKRSIGFDSGDWDIFCTGCVEEAVQVLRAARGAEMDTEYAPPRLRLALRRAQIHHLYPIGGHDELRGVIFIGEKLSEAAYTADDFAFLGVIAGQAALLVENAFLYENLAAQERVRQELAIARRIQLESLPQRPPRVEGLDVYGVSVPAQEVGGDYFDYLEGPNGHLTVMIGDVSGKGTSAALYMSKLQGIVRSLHGFALSPRQLFVRTNDLLGRDMERRAFVTVLGAFIDPVARTMSLARGGHLPLYHYEAATGAVHRRLPRGLGLGLTASDLFATELEEQHLTYAAGDVFLLVTDGITEAHGVDEEEFGEDRLIALFTTLALANTPVARIVSAVTTAAAEHAAGAPQHDDQTVIAIRAQ